MQKARFKVGEWVMIFAKITRVSEKNAEVFTESGNHINESPRNLYSTTFIAKRERGSDGK